MTTTVEKLLERRYASGTTVINCAVHMHRDILNRPSGCENCYADMRNALRAAIYINRFLNTWKEDATKLLLHREGVKT